MPKRSLVGVTAVVLTLAGCGAGSAFVPPMEDHSPPPRHPEPEVASRPYTIDELRAASPAGRWLRYRVIEGTSPAHVLEYRFVSVDADGAVIAETDGPEGVPPTAPRPARHTWEELASDASFPADATTIRPASVTVAAGTFDCQEYVVRRKAGDSETITTLDFAQGLPGPPVRTRIVAGGAPQLTMELIAYGGAAR